MIKGLFSQFLFKAILVALIGLALYGVFPGTGLAVIMVLFVGMRFASLGAEALRKPMSAAGWEAMLDRLTRAYETAALRPSAAKEAALRRAARLSPRELAQARINRARLSDQPPRPKRELGAEALGVVAFAVLIPLDIALGARDFFSLRTGQGWEGAGVAALCVALYAWPHRWLKSPDHSDVRIWWWAVPFVLALPLLHHLVVARHPYLNPLNPDHNRLAAERVLTLKNNIVAGRHADWVLRYARELDERGAWPQAIHFYHEGLRLNPGDRKAYARLASLEAEASSAGQPGNAARAASAPYWTARNPVIKPPRHRIDAQLENVEGCTVVVVAVGQVPDELLDAVGHVLGHELDLPLYISPDPVPLPPHTRVRGLATGPQWHESSIVQAFTNAARVFPNAPVRYVWITPVDIYMDEANYVFSSSYPWGAVVSSARFGGPNADHALLLQRTAKQALGALIKSFKVPASTDRNCVTSYTSSLEEFDAKGLRPSPETRALLRQAVADLNTVWQKHKALSRVPD